MPPTDPGQPAACTRPLKSMNPRNVAYEFAKPKTTLMAIDVPRPPRRSNLGPNFLPMKLQMN